jgi:hypothetical protein
MLGFRKIRDLPNGVPTSGSMLMYANQDGEEFLQTKSATIRDLMPLSFFEIDNGVMTVTERPTTFKKVGGNLYIKSACIGTATYRVENSKLIIKTK